MKSVLGQEPDIYALAEYDSAWIAALAILLAGKYDGEAIKNALPLAAKIYWGATGNIEFNEKGDRAYADVAFYAVINKEWRIIGVYKVLENKVSWILSPQEILKIS
jgi:branched-chain amino acid transport system substrate-binding protein